MSTETRGVFIARWIVRLNIKQSITYLLFGKNNSTCNVFIWGILFGLDYLKVSYAIQSEVRSLETFSCLSRKNLKTFQWYKLHNVVFQRWFYGPWFSYIFCLFQRKSSVYKRSYFGCGVTEKMGRPEKNICLIERKFFRPEPNLINRR